MKTASTPTETAARANTGQPPEADAPNSLLERAAKAAAAQPGAAHEHLALRLAEGDDDPEGRGGGRQQHGGAPHRLHRAGCAGQHAGVEDERIGGRAAVAGGAGGGGHAQQTTRLTQ